VAIDGSRSRCWLSSPLEHLAARNEPDAGVRNTCVRSPLFETVIRNNLDLGRPDRVSLLFPTRLQRNTPPPGLGYKTRVITRGVAPSLPFEFKHSRVKQYFKEQPALRTETTCTT